VQGLPSWPGQFISKGMGPAIHAFRASSGVKIEIICDDSAFNFAYSPWQNGVSRATELNALSPNPQALRGTDHLSSGRHLRRGRRQEDDVRP
jgi:hypothetical protein